MKCISNTEFLNDKQAVVVFSTEHCPKCKVTASVIAKLYDSHSDTIGTYKVILDDLPDVADEYGINTVPVTAVFRNGKMINKIAGSLSIPNAVAFCTKNLI